MDQDGLGNALADAQVRVERRGRILEDKADVPAQRPERTFLEVEHLVAEYLE